MKTFDCSPSNAHDVERIEELEKELKDLKERIINIEVTYTTDRRMLESFAPSSTNEVEKEIVSENILQMTREVYKSKAYKVIKEHRMLPSLSGSYDVIEFKHSIQVLRSKES